MALWRILPLAFAMGAVACGDLSAERGGAEDGNQAPSVDESTGGDSAPDSVECRFAQDCEPAASTCCECPSFALPVAAGFSDSCPGVECQDREPNCSTAVVATCNSGRCELACQTTVVDSSQFCSTGFAADEFGCLTATCAPTGSNEPVCLGDTDCVQAPADCCGCGAGGADTAVLANELDAHLDALSCNQAPSCPGVDVCDPEAAPRCLQGRCRLVSAPGDADMDGGVGTAEDVLCGRVDLDPCPAGQACVLNDPAAANASSLGLGVCRAE